MSPGDWVSNRPLWARWPWNALLGLLALALAAGGTVWALQPEDTSCAEGVPRVGEKPQCVGVTDGSHSFSTNLAAVSELIRAENGRVSRASRRPNGPSYVSIVYLMSLAPGPKDSNTPDSVRHEVQGSYTAQYEANHTPKYGDAPKVRLLLANTGSTGEQRSAALQEIRKRIDSDHIVAVAGLGTSTDATEKMVRTITADRQDGGLQLAAVGSVLTADTLSKVKGLVRAAPTNADEAAAAAAFLKRKPYAGKRVLVIQDARPDDQYTRTLGEAFLRAFPRDRPAPKVEQYDSSQEGVATAFKTRMANLCAAKPDVVYFAGRGVDLPRFLAPLKDRPCTDRELVVFSGDDVSQSAQAQGFDEIKETLRSGNVRLLYTGLAHPGAWQKAKDAYPGWAVQSFGTKGRYRTAFPEETLDDGQAIMGHDAVLTAVSGIRLAARASDSNGRVSGSQTIQIWKSLHGVEAVKGASGLISLGNDGSPEGKAVPIIEIKPDGTVRTLDVSARSGRPLVERDLN
ncbi:ABC transporter substrate-binding protein [Streptomyces sp. H27-D2]|uniref:ABC transporter substrate-binding protein n=1 Tax=Streptomyces sp. H27-D2 TaxID=3046304 RepID=UPI002DBDC3A4|nr:ABC transporter substrate-binding protein [Streptomyces sp. H27-D2]MEC4020890.1 ABC transporter substrate-binding protein [Streptomyces sp. H27-D2]